eukprot:211602_1
MNVLINNNLNEKALSIYNKFESIHDSLSHILYIKACINLENFEFGQHIIHKHNLLQNVTTIRLKNTLIDFYGKFGHILKSRNIFDS